MTDGFEVALWIWLLSGVSSWLYFGYRGVAFRQRVRLFEELVAPPLDAPPIVSIISPACNEADTIEAAARSLIAQTYSPLEVVLVDDRSTDGTGALVDALAAEDERVRAIHIDHLPEGWLGKVHALEVGFRAARGDWLLFTDADVHMHPETVAIAVRWAEAQGIDHLAVLPQVIADTLAAQAAVATFGQFFVATTSAAYVEDSDAYAGVGAFALVRRTRLEEAGGFEWIRLEIADDTGLALLIKRAGGRAAFAVARDHISVRWYGDLPAMMRGLEKNAFAVICRFSVVRLVFLVAVLLTSAIAPTVGLFVGPWWLRALAAVAWAGMVASAVGARRYARLPMAALLAFPLGELLLALMMVRSAARTLCDGGVVWRGTLYPLAALRAGQRVRL